MPLIESETQIVQNLRALEAIRRSGPNSESYTAYAKLIHGGRCLIPYEVNGLLHFAPSRFAGYIANSLGKHATADDRDGRKTNVAISKALGLPLVEDEQLDQLFRRFCNSLRGELRLKVPDIKRKFWMYGNADSFSDFAALESVENDPSLSSTTRKALIDARIGQGQFRRKLEKYWRKRCAATGCITLKLLRASHIRPWRNSDNTQRLDAFNGLLLSPNLDVLFDLGFITFDPSGSLVKSPELPPSDAAALLPAKGVKISVEERHQVYLEYHRTHVFRSGA